VIQIREFQDTPQDYVTLAHIQNKVWVEPALTADGLRQIDTERAPTFAHRRFLAEMSGQVVGFGSIEHNPKFYHPQRFWMGLDVLPDARRQGIGGYLYEHMLALLQSEYNANELHALTTESRAESIRFLNKRGFQESKRDPKSRLDVASFDGGQFRELRAGIAIAGIEVESLSALMQQDEDALHKVYELHQTLVNDVPEPAEHTRVAFEFWREGYSPANPYFIPEANFVALDGTTYVGLSSLWGELTSDKLYTGMSGVERSYRRKGIATTLKLCAIEYAQAHDVRWLMTSNNSENPMYRLNLKLGFQTYDTEIKLMKKLWQE
jgi:GNAT superfamily N-acetyltransferase